MAHDVIIIGGGVMGLFIALDLKRRGVTDVVILEKRFCGAGSSGKSGAICRQHYSNEVTAGLARDSIGVYAARGPAQFITTGCLFLADPRERETLMKSVELQRSWGIRTEMIDVERAMQLEPRLDYSDEPAVCWETNAGYCRAQAVLASLEAEAIACGVEMRCDVRVRSIDADGCGITLDDGSTLRAETVVNAANAWAAPLAATAGVELPIRVTKPQIAFTARPVDEHGESPTHPVLGDLIHGYYARPDAPGVTLLGGLDMELDPELTSADAEEEGIDDAVVMTLNERLARRMPMMRRGRSRGGMGALYACTPDYHAIIGRHDKAPGLITCAGFSGHGFKMAPEVGREVGALITTGAYERHDMMIFRPSRFAEDDPVRGRYEYSLLG